MAVRILERAEGLERAFELLGDELAKPVRDEAAADLLIVRKRAVLDPETVVIALVGATGSGKSSLFNALIGDALAEVDVLRPTTRAPLAAHSPDLDAAELLDWLGVERRARVEGMRIPGNAVILDLPDIDSRAAEHRKVARRVSERADMILWVVDPQKYADDVIHSEWVAPMAGSAGATAMVLNQIDRLSASEREEVLSHLRRLLDEDGAHEGAVLGVSAATGEGIASLADVIGAVARTVRASAVKAFGALERVADDLRSSVGVPDSLPPFDSRGLAQALAEEVSASSGLDGLADAIGASYRHRGITRAAWIPTRWIRHLRSDPARRAHLRRNGEHPGDPVVGFGLDAVGRARTSTALRRVGTEIGRGRPQAWAEAMLSILARIVDALPGLVDRVVGRATLDPEPRRRWWAVATGIQAFAWVVAGAGALWLAGARLLEDALFVTLEMPLRHGVPIPAWCLVLGLAVTLLIALVSRIGIAWGAARSAARAKRRLRGLLRDELVAGPLAALEAEDARQREIVRLLRPAPSRCGE